MEGDEQMNNIKPEETGRNSADFFVMDELNQPLAPAARLKSTVREKINTALVLVVAVFAVFLGYYQLSYNISHPFTYAETKSSTNVSADDLKLQLATIIAEQNKDTDGDGLTDAQEINVYYSSPFLDDSDSDSIADGVEIRQGTDPNCPSGQNCFNQTAASGNSSSVPAFSILPETGSLQITPASIRAALKQGGVSEADLSEFTDADLIALYQDVLKSEPSMAQTAQDMGLDLTDAPAAASAIAITPSAINSSTVNLNVQSLDDLKKFSGTQIRQLLLQSGAPAAVLAQVTDDQLKTIFLEKLNEKNGAVTP